VFWFQALNLVPGASNLVFIGSTCTASSSAEIIGAFNTCFDTVDLHRPTVDIAECNEALTEPANPGEIRHDVITF